MESTAENKIVHINKDNKDFDKSKDQETYCNIGSPETGSIEIDLVTFRQKNQESKFLTISIKNPDDVKDNSFAIDNEEAFNILKNFFAQLTWNS